MAWPSAPTCGEPHGRDGAGRPRGPIPHPADPRLNATPPGRTQRPARRESLSASEARWLALDAQGLAEPRRSPGTKGRASLKRVMDQVGTIQLDAVNVLERTQFVVPFSRIGPYERPRLLAMIGPGRPWFEYWGHAASLLPVSTYPLFRSRMAQWRDDQVDSPTVGQRRREWRAAHADYLAAVLREVTERGPLAASQLSEPRRRDGEWWGRRSDGRRALEVLFAEGVLAAWRSPSFERVYDLTERVIPSSVLDLVPPPLDEAQRELVLLAAARMGVSTATDLAAYFGLRTPVARLRVAELVEAGRLLPVVVEGWRQPGYVLGDPRPRPPRREHGTLLSPFDSLIWSRDRTERLFGFRYRIEIYVPGPQRTHGYYVLPMLLGDRLVARFDLKADRRLATLRVVSAHLEPGAEKDEVAVAAATELRAMGSWLGLGRLEVGANGDLSAALRRVSARSSAVAPA